MTILGLRIKTHVEENIEDPTLRIFPKYIQIQIILQLTNSIGHKWIKRKDEVSYQVLMNENCCYELFLSDMF
jgi:hypothetical protein